MESIYVLRKISSKQSLSAALPIVDFFSSRRRRLRKEIPQKEIRRIARVPWKKLNTNFVSYADDDIVILD